METVTIACKVPSGMHLDVTIGGVQKRVTVQGAALPRGADVDVENLPRVQGGFGITPGVPKDHWDTWLKDHKDAPPVKNGMIFAAPKAVEAEARAKDQADLKSGFEPMDRKEPAPKLAEAVE